MLDWQCTCRPSSGRVNEDVGGGGAVVPSAEPARADARQMQSFTGPMTTQHGAVVVDALHRRIVGRPSDISAAIHCNTPHRHSYNLSRFRRPFSCYPRNC